jgi:hypothetical protein
MSPSEHAEETHVQTAEHRAFSEVSWCINTGRLDFENFLFNSTKELGGGTGREKTTYLKDS